MPIDRLALWSSAREIAGAGFGGREYLRKYARRCRVNYVFFLIQQLDDRTEFVRRTYVEQEKQVPILGAFRQK